ncbi:MAG TPA: hypothetical protein VFR34_12305, partial [Paracoccaceae bacterium]|nr:hypothetical protein [Paracoccaceae bacterium]
PDLVLAYFLDFDDISHALQGLEMVPFQLRRFRLNRASAGDVAWLAGNLDRQCQPFGTSVELAGEGAMRLSWQE